MLYLKIQKGKEATKVETFSTEDRRDFSVHEDTNDG